MGQDAATPLGASGTGRVRVLVVDDSPICRDLLVEMLNADPSLDIAGMAVDGADAVAKAGELTPDVITMDLRMPVMDGIEATRVIMAQNPTPILVLTGHPFQAGRNMTFDAIRAGALDLMIKPELGNLAQEEKLRHDLTRLIKFLAGMDVKAPRTAPRAQAAMAARSREVSIVAIAGSSGGPRAMRDVLAGLPASFPAGIVVVQHIADGFTRDFAEWLDSECELTVRQADDSDVVRRGQVLVAPSEAHVRLLPGGACRMIRGQPINGYRPSADVLMSSVARHHGESACGIVLAGMGEDGVAGLADIKTHGGVTIAQDEGASRIAGTPKAAVDRGVVDFLLPVESIAAHLMRLCEAPQAAQGA